MSLLPQTIEAWRAAVEVSPEAVAASLLREIESLPESLRRATLAHIPELETLQASMLDAQHRGILAGVPFFVKDLYDIQGLPTRAGSVFLDTLFELPTRNAQFIDRLQSLGAVCAGKTQLVEFAYGMTGENPHYGDCPHPHLPHALAGGSSSGSAWAVGRGLVPLALGTDTAGSIRVPAAFCGVYGIRLAPGFECGGVFPLAQSFDTVGWFTHNAQDMLSVCQAFFSQTYRSHQERALYIGDHVPFADFGLKDRCLQLAQKLHCEQDPELAQWLKHSWQQAATAYFILSSHEAAHTHREWLDPLRSRYDPAVWARLDQGRRWSDAELETARAVQKTIVSRFKDYFQSYEALVLPVTPLPSPSKSAMNDTFRQALLSLNTPVSLAGLPALTLPVMLPNQSSGALQVVFPSLERMDVAPWLLRAAG